MKTILLTVVLGVTMVAVGQNTAAPARQQPAAPAAQAQPEAGGPGRHKQQRLRAGCRTGDQRSGRIQRVRRGDPAEGCQRQDQRPGSISYAIS